MASNRLQLRRDLLANFQTSNTAPLVGEPTYVRGENRIRIADALSTNVGRIPNPIPPGEGSLFHSIWNSRAYSTANAVNVPAWPSSKTDSVNSVLDTPAVRPYFTAFSGAIPDYFAQDAGVIKINVSGDYLVGSTDPSMAFGLTIGDMEGVNETDIGPDPGLVGELTGVGALAGKRTGTSGPFLTVGNTVGMVNVLGDYNKPVVWNLEATIAAMGSTSVSPFKTSQTSLDELDTTQTTVLDPENLTLRSDLTGEVLAGDNDNANVRVYGRLTIMDPFVSTGGNKSYLHFEQFGAGQTIAGYTFTGNKQGQGTSFDWASYSTAGDAPTNLPRGTVVSCHGNTYEALGEIPGESYADIEAMPTSTLGELNSKISRINRAHMMRDILTPGSGRKWTHYWRPRKTVIDFSFEEYVPNINQKDQFLKLKVGGPTQSDPTVTYNDWSVAPGASGYLGNDGSAAPGISAGGTFVNTGIPGAWYRGKADYIGAGADLTRRITPDGGVAADYVTRIPHTLDATKQFSTTNDNWFTPMLGVRSDLVKVYYNDPEASGEADGEWNCYWRRLADDRADKMRIHHSTAYAYGGRLGTNDYRPF